MFRCLTPFAAANLSSDAVVNPGWYGYAYGVSGDNNMIIDEGPNALYGDSLVQAELINAPARWSPWQVFFGRTNPPPLLLDGTAQRTHPNILGLVEFTPIGAGEIHLHDIVPVNYPQDMIDIATWTTGLGQLANEVAIVMAAAENQGSGAVQGAGVTQVPYILPSDLTVGYAPSNAPNAGAYP